MMEIHTVYCSARDRDVRVAFEWIPDSIAGSEIDPASGVCLGYCSRECTGSMCALFDEHPRTMLARLRRGGLLPDGVDCQSVENEEPTDPVGG
jgi:hypothetical protein